MGGIALGALTLVFRDLIRRSFFPKLEKSDAYRLLRLVVIAVWTVALAGLGAWAWGQANPTTVEHHVPALPGETGWIFAGYYDDAQNRFIEGPYVSLESAMARGNHRFAATGDRIRTRVQRRVIIANFQSIGTKDKLMSPTDLGVISAKDETGLVIPPGCPFLVREVAVLSPRYTDCNLASGYTRPI